LLRQGLIGGGNRRQIKNWYGIPAGTRGREREALADEIQVGEWCFTPATATIVRAEERRRIEHRAAKVLELLCARRGEPVSAEELTQAVWGGRALSPNSVAVVIADLRRALDDDARAPRYIETIPKRGYRLLVPVEAAQVAAPLPSRRIPGHLVVVALALIAVVAAGLWWTRAPEPYRVSLAAIPNATEHAAYGPLAAAVTDLVGAELSGLERVQVMRGEGAVDARISGRLVLWNGQASVSLSAVDPRTGAVLWSGMAAGPASQLPRQLHALVADFGKKVPQPGP
jgi:DNA-binding winged helix-turn-helix (wHTH) protein